MSKTFPNACHAHLMRSKYLLDFKSYLTCKCRRCGVEISHRKHRQRCYVIRDETNKRAGNGEGRFSKYVIVLSKRHKILPRKTFETCKLGS